MSKGAMFGYNKITIEKMDEEIKGSNYPFTEVEY